MHDFAFHFEKIGYSKKHLSTLNFKGSCTHSNGREVIIKYTGPDISNESTVAIPSDILGQLHTELKTVFGNGPFDIQDARKTLNTKNSYYFDYMLDNE
jgi:hypothetical protein